MITETAVPLTHSLINKITDAFHSTPVLEAFGILQIGNVPENMADMSAYGDVCIDCHFVWF